MDDAGNTLSEAAKSLLDSLYMTAFFPFLKGKESVLKGRYKGDNFKGDIEVLVDGGYIREVRPLFFGRKSKEKFYVIGRNGLVEIMGDFWKNPEPYTEFLD